MVLHSIDMHLFESARDRASAQCVYAISFKSHTRALLLSSVAAKKKTRAQHSNYMPIFRTGTTVLKTITLWPLLPTLTLEKSVQPTSVSLALACFRIACFFRLLLLRQFLFVAIEKHSFLCTYSILCRFQFNQTDSHVPQNSFKIQAFCHSFALNVHLLWARKWKMGLFMWNEISNFIIVFTGSRKTN